jgi:hypothetical protein
MFKHPVNYRQNYSALNNVRFWVKPRLVLGTISHIRTENYANRISPSNFITSVNFFKNHLFVALNFRLIFRKSNENSM